MPGPLEELGVEIGWNSQGLISTSAFYSSIRNATYLYLYGIKRVRSDVVRPSFPLQHVQ